MKKRIVIKERSSKKEEAFNKIFDLLVNDFDISFYRDSDGDLRIFLENASGWGLILSPDGTWKVE